MPELAADCRTAAPDQGYLLRQVMTGAEDMSGVLFEATPSLARPSSPARMTPLACRPWQYEEGRLRYVARSGQLQAVEFFAAITLRASADPWRPRKRR